MFFWVGGPAPKPLRGGFAPCIPIRAAPWTPFPRAIAHLLHELTQAAKFYVLIEKNNIRTSRRKCSCKLAWSSRYSVELIATSCYLTRWQPSAFGLRLSFSRSITLNRDQFGLVRPTSRSSAFVHFRLSTRNVLLCATGVQTRFFATVNSSAMWYIALQRNEM